MKQKNKLKVIWDSFTKESDLDPKIIKERRDICNSCPYNSKNKDITKLSLFEKIRVKFIESPFCTACGCQIKEKTSQATEQCGLIEIDKLPKWKKIKIETIDNMDLNVLNLSTNLVDIDLDEKNNVFIVDYGSINLKSPTAIQLGLQTKDEDIKILDAKPGCGGCTKLQLNNKKGLEVLDIRLDLKKIYEGKFRKSVTIKYSYKEKMMQSKILLTGNLNKK